MMVHSIGPNTFKSIILHKTTKSNPETETVQR